MIYSFFKDFAAPIATVIAAITAAYFVWRQWQTAQNQAATALDQLRYNLFEKRYAIYEDARELLIWLYTECDEPNFRPQDAFPHFMVMNQAVFLFSTETWDWLESVRQDCEKLLKFRESWNGSDSAEHEILMDMAEKLMTHLKEMPERFRNELSFRQLTQSNRI